MNYGEIRKTAFTITRRNRYLWVFGLFAGATSSLNFPTNFAPPSDDERDLFAQGTPSIDRGGERRFKTAWRSGTRAFWRVLGWAALLVVFAVGILIVVGVPLGGMAFGVFSATESVGVRIAVGIILALLAIAALIVLFVPLQIVAALAVRDLVLREESPVAAFRNGCRMFRAQLGPSLLVWLIQLGITIGVTIVTLVLVIGLTLAVAIPTIALFAADLAAAAVALLVLAALIVIPLFSWTSGRSGPSPTRSGRSRICGWAAGVSSPPSDGRAGAARAAQPGRAGKKRTVHPPSRPVSERSRRLRAPARLPRGA